ncbi:MAG: hypothetical protein AAGJ82_00630 [Bacteroidota bacterium]
MKTLHLFQAVIARPTDQDILVLPEGYIIEPGARWAEEAIKAFYAEEKLDGFGLNKTFHKSWQQIHNSTRLELWEEQVRHYASTYGSNFRDVIYIPGEVLNVPDTKLVFKLIKAYTAEEMTNKCLTLLRAGLALKETTLDDILTILVDELGYQFDGKEGIKNKEAIVKIADMYGVLPQDTMTFLRYLIYRATGESLLIKNEETIAAIKASTFNPAVLMQDFGLEKLATIFNRFKPLFLAFKPRCAKTINKLSKLSKKHHQPLVTNPLNSVTSVLLTEQDRHWLDNATPFALFKALTACHTRKQGQHAFAYRIRNGKSFVKKGRISGVVWPNYDFLLAYLKERFDLTNKRFFLPHNVEYALPTSEKMYVGHIPTGTRFTGKALAVGIYWENAGGATDLDLSGLNVGGKIGWNADYKQGQGELLYSGDITNAPNGAVEYLYAQNGLQAPTLVQNNVFSGAGNCEYKIIVGQGDNIDHKYMMNPNKLMVETKCQSIQRQTILGILIPEKAQQCFVLLNFGAGQAHVSGNSEVSRLATQALFQQWERPLSFRELIVELGGVVAAQPTQADYDFSLDKLQKDSFLRVFTA